MNQEGEKQANWITWALPKHALILESTNLVPKCFWLFIIVQLHVTIYDE
jgi:hypothetical protein